MKIYSITTQDSYSVGVLASEELAKEIESMSCNCFLVLLTLLCVKFLSFFYVIFAELPRVLYVWPDFYLFPEEKRYAGMKLYGPMGVPYLK